MLRGVFFGLLLSIQITFIAIFGIRFGDEDPLMVLPIISSVLTIVIMVYIYIEDGGQY